MNKPTVIFGGAVLTVTAIALFTLNDKPQDIELDNEPRMSVNPERPPSYVPTPTPEKSASTNKQSTNTTPFNREKYEHIAERLDAMQARRPNKSFNPELVEQAVKRETAWQTTDEIPTTLPLSSEQLNDGRQFIKLDALKIETLQPGDTVKIDIAEIGENYQIVVDEIIKHDYASISWYGHIEGQDGQSYPVHFTRGDSLTVGGINTPDGHFVLQGHSQDGWIASSGKLFKVDPDQPDAIYPEDISPNGNEPNAVHDHAHDHSHDHSLNHNPAEPLNSNG